MPPYVLLATQDGGDFYADCTIEALEIKEGEIVWRAPFPVADHDNEAARRANREFRNWCATQNIFPSL